MFKMSTKLKVKKINKTTSAQMFKNLEIGDIVEFATGLSGSGGTYRGCYAKYVNCHNLTKNESVIKSFNQLSPMYNFEWDIV